MTAAMRDWSVSSSSAICFWGGHRLKRNSAVGKTVADNIFNLCCKDRSLDLAWPAFLQKDFCIALRVACQHGRTEALESITCPRTGMVPHMGQRSTDSQASALFCGNSAALLPSLNWRPQRAEKDSSMVSMSVMPWVYELQKA